MARKTKGKCYIENCLFEIKQKYCISFFANLFCTKYENLFNLTERKTKNIPIKYQKIKIHFFFLLETI